MPYQIEARKIRIDRGTQARVGIDQAVVKDYAEAMLREMSSREIAREVGVGNRFVTDVRYEMQRNEEIPWYVTPAQRAAKALADPANEGKTNREIATLCHVAEKTVRNVRSADFVSGTQNPQVPEDQPEEVEAKESTHKCRDFGHYVDNKKCLLDEKIRTPWTDACDDFMDANPPEPETVRMPLPEKYKVIDERPIEKKLRRTPHTYRRLKGTLQLHLPRDNPQLFAVELPTRTFAVGPQSPTGRS